MYVHNGVIYRNPNESNHLMITTLETNETKTYKMNGVDETSILKILLQWIMNYFS